MADPNPTPVDGKWYNLPKAQKRQQELINTMPTGTGWWWHDRNGNEVVFTY